ncbi:MAG: cytochrome C biogenesis protein [Acidimicrobiia bacterium]|nr:cytochrome C biogenesis protein [Acidimicrobiia bacterium]MYC86208.1 cytochrome C biogenesis protein [Acidimicrobiia bacterium]
MTRGATALDPTSRATTAAGVVALCLVAVGLYMSVTAPAEETQGEAARLLFVHVPSAITAYVALGTGLVTAAWYLIRRSAAADLVSAAAIEVGVLFTAITLLTGMIWGRFVWGLWWDWGDARMVSTAVMFFFYLGYLALRRSITDHRVRAVRCAVLGIVGFVQVPIVHYSVLWFRTLHQGPSIIRPDLGNSTMDAAFIAPLGAALAAFIAVLAYLVAVRVRIARLEAAVARSTTTSQPVGASVSPPSGLSV